MQNNTTVGAGLVANQADPRVLLDWSQPFDDFKVQVLENVVNVMLGGVGQNVSAATYSLNYGAVEITSQRHTQLV